MQEISLSDLFKAVWRHIILIIVVTVAVAAAVMVLVAPKNSSHFEATGQVVLRPTTKTVNDSGAQNAYTTQMVATSKDILSSTAFLKKVSKQLSRKGIDASADQLYSDIEIKNQINSLLLEIKTKSDTAKDAQAITNATLKAFKASAPDYLSLDRAVVMKSADAKQVTGSSRTQIKYLLAGIVLGGVLSLVLVFILEFIRHTVRDTRYLEKKYGIKTIQTI